VSFSNKESEPCCFAGFVTGNAFPGRQCDGQFYLEPPNLFVELGLLGVVGRRQPLAGWRKDVGRSLEELLLPVSHEVDVNLEVGSDLTDGAIAFVMAANATWALKAGVCVRIVLLILNSQLTRDKPT
jgi:hypothetical protein